MSLHRVNNSASSSLCSGYTGITVWVREVEDGVGYIALLLVLLILPGALVEADNCPAIHYKKVRN